MDPDAIPEFTDNSEEVFKRPKLAVKPLFKLNVGDLLAMPFDQPNDCFKFQDHNVSLVMCGGKITDIFRDDSIFAFELDDGTGSIRCFHKFKYDRDTLQEKLDQNSTSVHFLQNTFVSDESHVNEDTIFNPRVNDSVVKQLEDDTLTTLNEVLFWFKNQVIEKQKVREIGNLVHVTGHLLDDESIRKINVLDFRIVENELENQDFKLEIEYLRKFVYV